MNSLGGYPHRSFGDAPEPQAVPDACAEFARAASLTKNTRERDVLLARAERCGGTRRS